MKFLPANRVLFILSILKKQVHQNWAYSSPDINIFRIPSQPHLLINVNEINDEINMDCLLTINNLCSQYDINPPRIKDDTL